MSEQPQLWTTTESPSLPRNPMLAALKSNTAVNKVSNRRKSKDEGILEQINEFHTSLRTDLVPEYDKLEAKLTDSITDVSDRVDRLNDLRRERRELAEVFFGKVGDTKSEIDGQLQKIREWHQNDRDIAELQDRMNKARHDLDIYKERLAQLAEETEIFEAVNAKEERRTRRVAQTVIFCVLVIFLAILTHYDYLSMPKYLRR